MLRARYEGRWGCRLPKLSLGTLLSQTLMCSPAQKLFTFLSGIWDDPLSGSEDSALRNHSAPLIHVASSPTSMHIVLLCQIAPRPSRHSASITSSVKPAVITSTYVRVQGHCPLHLLPSWGLFRCGETVCILHMWELLEEMTVVFIFMTLVLGPGKSSWYIIFLTLPPGNSLATNHVTIGTRAGTRVR